MTELFRLIELYGFLLRQLDGGTFYEDGREQVQALADTVRRAITDAVQSIKSPEAL
jgi:hypothetical protein